MVLKGIVLTADEHGQAAEVVAAVPGVTAVDNQLRLMTTSTTLPCSGQSSCPSRGNCSAQILPRCFRRLSVSADRFR